MPSGATRLSPSLRFNASHHFHAHHPTSAIAFSHIANIRRSCEAYSNVGRKALNEHHNFEALYSVRWGAAPRTTVLKVRARQFRSEVAQDSSDHSVILSIKVCRDWRYRFASSGRPQAAFREPDQRFVCRALFVGTGRHLVSFRDRWQIGAVITA